MPSALPLPAPLVVASRPRADLRTGLFWTALEVLFALGIFLRVHPTAGFQGVGFDENLYARDLQEILLYGPGAYPDIVEAYDIQQARDTVAALPPTRALFLLSAAAWHGLFGGTALGALHAVSALAGVLTLAAATAFAWRWGGKPYALCVLALMAVAPLEIVIAQRAWIDGFFGCWALLALWGLWECLQPPANRAGGWLWLYGIALAALVLTKENSFFVVVALGGLLALNRWARFGEAGPQLWTVTIAAPALGLATARGIDMPSICFPSARRSRCWPPADFCARGWATSGYSSWRGSSSSPTPQCAGCASG